MSLVVFSEIAGNLEEDDDLSTDMVPLARAATSLGLPIHFVGTRLWAPGALEQVAAPSTRALAFWSGHLPTPENYADVYGALSGRGFQLVNRPEEHVRAVELEVGYPLIAGLTAETIAVGSRDE